MHRLAIISLAIWLAACAQTLDNTPLQTTRVVRVSAKSPESVYRTLVTAVRRCNSGPLSRVEADYFSDSRTGVIKVFIANSTVSFEILRIELASTENGGARITSLHEARRDATFNRDIDAWLDEQPRECS